MKHRPDKHTKPARETISGFGPIAVLALIILIALVVYAVRWVSLDMLKPASSSLPQPPSATPAETAESELTTTSMDAIGLAHTSAALETISLNPDRLVEFHTIDEIMGRTPNPVVSVDQRISKLEHGTYPELNAKLKNVLGEPLNSAIMQFAVMSHAERLLLYYDWVGTPAREDAVFISFISKMNEANLAEITGYGMLDAIWTEGDRQELTAIYRQSNGDKAKLKALLTEQWLPRYCSPVALRFFEPWHKEWATGMGYICEVRNPGQRKNVVSAVLDLQMRQSLSQPPDSVVEHRGSATIPDTTSGKPADAMDYYKFFYYRVYGTKPGTVLAEGIMQVESFQAQQHRWDTKPAVKP